MAKITQKHFKASTRTVNCDVHYNADNKKDNKNENILVYKNVIEFTTIDMQMNSWFEKLVKH